MLCLCNTAPGRVISGVVCLPGPVLVSVEHPVWAPWGWARLRLTALSECLARDGFRGCLFSGSPTQAAWSVKRFLKSINFVIFCFVLRQGFAVQLRFKLRVVLPQQNPECWDHSCVPPHTAQL